MLAFGVDVGLSYLAQLGGFVFGAFIAAFFGGTHAPKAVVDHAMNVGAAFGWVYWTSVCWFLNHGVLQGLTGATAGKWVFGLRVMRADGARLGVLESLIRSACYFASALPFGAGFLSPLWDPEARAWHDRICESRVVRSRPDAQVTALPTSAEIPAAGISRHAA